jgi:hypothetical protein
MKFALFLILVSVSLNVHAQEKVINNYVKSNDRLAMVFDVNNRAFIDALNDHTFTQIINGTFNNTEIAPDITQPSCVIAQGGEGFINGGVVDFDPASVREESHYTGESLRVQFSGFIGMGTVMDCFKPTPTPFTDRDLNSIFGKLGEVFQWQKLNANEYNSKLYLN